MFLIKQFISAGIHLGHKTNKWNPKAASFLFAIKKDIHIIDIEQTILMIRRALNFIKKVCEKRGYLLSLSLEAPSASGAASPAGAPVVCQPTTAPPAAPSKPSGSAASGSNEPGGPVGGSLRVCAPVPTRSQVAVGTGNGSAKLGAPLSQQLVPNLEPEPPLQHAPHGWPNFPSVDNASSWNIALVSGSAPRSKGPLLRQQRLRSSQQREAKRSAAGFLLGTRQHDLYQRIPEVLFVPNVNESAILVKEAIKLQIPIIGVIDTDSNPFGIQYPIPGNAASAEARFTYASLIANAIAEAKRNELKILSKGRPRPKAL